jgi:hypothetical protein
MIFVSTKKRYQHVDPLQTNLCRKRSQVQRSPFRVSFLPELALMPENKGYRSEIRSFSSDFMDVRVKNRARKNKPKVLIYAL